MLFAFFILFIQGSCDPEPPEPPVNTDAKVSIPDFELIEGGEEKEITMKVTISNDYEGTRTINYVTDDRSAFAGQDYMRAEGSVTFTSPETEKEITIKILGDGFKEGNEEFNIHLTTLDDVEFTKKSAFVRIINDDSDFPGGANGGFETPVEYENWELSWQDEFTTEIDSNSWNFEIGNGANGWGNNELEYYTAREENVRIENGKLVIEAREENYEGYSYTSTRMTTQGKKEFGKSRVDVRAKLPEGQGIWPAIWMLGININETGWPNCGEIDIMELVGHEASKSHATVHFGPDPGSHQYKGGSITLQGEKFIDEFHVFTVVRETNKMWFYMDDILFYEFDNTQVTNATYPFNQPFFFILNVAVGGNWPGSPDASTSFPQRMEVDYIRVFEKKPL